MHYIGLDTATVTGVGMFNTDSHKSIVALTKGTPIEQMVFISKLVEGIRVLTNNEEMVVVMEKHHNFLNADTTRSLLERHGYLKYTLLSAGYRVEEVSPKVARHWLGVKDKVNTMRLLSMYYQGIMFTSDHADALAIAVYQAALDKYSVDVTQLQIRSLDYATL